MNDSRSISRLIEKIIFLTLFAELVQCAPNMYGIKNEDRPNSAHISPKYLFPKGVRDESELRTCDKWEVCSRADTYSRPWIERLCSCTGGQRCSSSLKPDDGHTVLDKPRQYKVCESADRLPTCRFFRDVTWSFEILPNNVSRQIVKCKCPENSTPYLSGREIEHSSEKFHFACSPRTTMRCRRKEPCRLFSVSKRYPVEEVTSSTLCQCPVKTYCPKRHMDPFVVESRDSTPGQRIFSGYCWPAG